MGGKSSTQTTKQTNEPPQWAKPMLTTGADALLKLFEQGKGFNVYGGSTVAPQSDATLNALGSLSSPTSANMLNQWGVGAGNNALNVINNNGLTGSDRSSISMLGNLARRAKTAGGTASDAAQTASDAAAAAGAAALRTRTPTAGENYLTATARGDYLKGSPWLNEAMDAGSLDIANDVSSVMSGMGRYGSGAHQGVVGDSVGDFRRDMLNDNFSRERGLMTSAADSLIGAEQGRMGLEQGFMGQQQGFMGQQQGFMGQQQGFMGVEGSAASGKSDISNRGLQTALGYTNALPAIQNAATAGSRNQLMAGGMTDAFNQRVLDDEVNRWRQNDMSEWERAAALLSGGVTAAGPWGTQNATTTTTQPFNPFSMLGGLGSLFAPFMQTSAMSDVDQKDDISRYGTTPGGFPVYTFTFKDGIERGPWFVPVDGDIKSAGVLAQEVAETMPDAVSSVDGILYVDYAKIH